jgi:hypothetical protein
VARISNQKMCHAIPLNDSLFLTPTFDESSVERTSKLALVFSPLPTSSYNVFTPTAEGYSWLKISTDCFFLLVRVSRPLHFHSLIVLVNHIGNVEVDRITCVLRKKTKKSDEESVSGITSIPEMVSNPGGYGMSLQSFARL